MEPYLFVFDDEGRAKRFVERLAHYVKDVAIFRDGPQVQVFDGSDNGQRERIYELAKTSDAKFTIPIPRKT